MSKGLGGFGPLVVAALAASAAAQSPPGYDDMRAAAIKACRAIDSADYQSFLLFNPDGYRSYYVQSECFQRVAIEFRDQALCSLVNKRPSLFSSSWGYSEANCLKLAAAGVAADEAALGRIKHGYQRDAVRLRDFRIEPNGNGRDFDLIPEFSGSFAHRYLMQFELDGGDGKAVIERGDFRLDGTNNIRLFIRQSDLLTRVPQLTPGRTYAVRATLVLDPGRGSPGAQWSDAFIERVFPARERAQSIVREVRFPLN